MRIFTKPNEHPSFDQVFTWLTAVGAERVYLWPGNRFFALGDVAGIIGPAASPLERQDAVLVEVQFNANQPSGARQAHHWGWKIRKHGLPSQPTVLVDQQAFGPDDFFHAATGSQMEDLYRACVDLEQAAMEVEVPYQAHMLLSQEPVQAAYQWARRKVPAVGCAGAGHDWGWVGQ